MQQHSTSWPSTALQAALVLLPVGFCILFGAANPLLAAALVGCTGVLGALAVLGGHMRSQAWLPPVWLGLPALLLGCWMLLQNLPLTQPLVANLANPLWQSLAQVIPGARPTISLDSWQSLTVASHFLAYALLFWLSATFGGPAANATPAIRSLRWLAIGGLAICVYGFMGWVIGDPYILWIEKVQYLNSLTGTFINHNTFGTFGGLVLLACLALALLRVGEIPRQARAAERWRAFLVLVLRPGWPWLLAAGFALLCLILSQSRAGFMFSLIAAVQLLALLIVFVRPARMPLLACLAAIAAFGAVAFGFTAVHMQQRMGHLAEDAGARATLYHLTTNAFLDNLWLGTGSGTFEGVFHQYRTPELSLRNSLEVDHAHNSWLENALELGFPAFVLLCATIGGIAVLLGQGVVNRRRGVVWPVLGLSALTLTSLHALVDFSPDIPGFTAYLAVLLGLCVGQSRPSPKSAKSSRSNTPVVETPAKPTPIWLQTGILGASAVLMAAGGIVIVACLCARPGQNTLLDLRLLHPVTTTQLFQAQQSLQKAQSILPLPAFSRDLALARLALAQRYGNDTANGALYLASSQQALQDALRHAPADPFSWYRLARVQSLRNRPQAAAPALGLSLITGPAEPNLLWARLPVMAAVWDDLTPDDRTLAISNVQLAWGHNGRLTWEMLEYAPGGPQLLIQALANSPSDQADWTTMTNQPWPPQPVKAETSPLTTTPAASKVPPAQIAPQEGPQQDKPKEKSHARLHRRPRQYGR